MGYRSTPLEGAPFDEARGVIPNARGRVEGGAPWRGGAGGGAGGGVGLYKGLYVTGWLKRGPTGVILTNVSDAAETAAAVLLHDPIQNPTPTLHLHPHPHPDPNPGPSPHPKPHGPGAA